MLPAADSPFRRARARRIPSSDSCHAAPTVSKMAVSTDASSRSLTATSSASRVGRAGPLRLQSRNGWSIELGFWIAPVAAVVIVGLCTIVAYLHPTTMAGGTQARARFLDYGFASTQPVRASQSQGRTLFAPSVSAASRLAARTSHCPPWRDATSAPVATSDGSCSLRRS